jgi:anti-sigma factor RsiW
MSCGLRAQLDLYADGELRKPELQQFETHLRSCPSCAAEALGRMQLKRAVHTAATQAFIPPVELKARLQKALTPRKTAFQLWLPRLVFSAAVVAVAIAAALLVARHRPQQDLLAEAIDLHVSALASANPVDIVSTDRHTVKPWFQGKLPFTFNVPELGNSRFHLIGGRMAYIGQNPAAQLVFGVNKHQISVFIFKDTGRLPESALTEQQFNFSLETWTENGLRFVAVTDAGMADVQALSSLFCSAH